ncbi:class I SAM-dependent methyltransferase [Candidatus Micrarchaeota archaeon]|nr:class I SAM-dependent methyltransferase [Candidatus Micrarchaeota archaeon]
MVNLSKYYEEHWKTKKGGWKPWFDNILENISKGSNILEVGCGKGILLNTLKKKKDCKVTGVDIISKPDSIDFPFFTVDIDSEPLPFDSDSFDYVICTEVLEHLFNPEKAIDELARVSKDKLLISIPNTRYVGYSVRLLFFGVFYSLQSKDHLNFWTSKDFISILKSKNLIVLKYEGVKEKKWGFLSRIFPDLFSGIIVYFASKKEKS